MEVSYEEARALQLFRSSRDVELIKGVIIRELNLTRDQFENEVADDTLRKTILAYKVALNVLFEEPLVSMANE